MAKLIMCKGLPASGKSTWACSQNCQVVNKDYLRTIYTSEKKVLEIRDSLIKCYLKQGMDVICDDTNLNPKHEQRLRQIAEELSAKFEIKEFDISVEEAVRRDKERLKPVGAMVIRHFYNKWIKNNGASV